MKRGTALTVVPLAYVLGVLALALTGRLDLSGVLSYALHGGLLAFGGIGWWKYFEGQTERSKP